MYPSSNHLSYTHSVFMYVKYLWKLANQKKMINIYCHDSIINNLLAHDTQLFVSIYIKSK